MKLEAFDVLQPADVEETMAHLRKFKDRAVVKAGGTALIPEMKAGLVRPEYVVTLSSAEGMDGIEERDDGLHIGAMASLYDVKNHEVVQGKYPALADAVEAVSAPSMHYQSTIGGNICQNTRCQFYNQSEFWRGVAGQCFKRGGGKCLAAPGAKRCGSVYQGDLAAILMAMGAQVRILTPRKERTIDLENLFTGKGENPLRLKPNELLVEVIIPPAEGKGFAYEKLRLRESLDYPVLGVAVMMELKGERCIDNRFVITAAGPKPIIISEPFLKGREIGNGFIEDAADYAYKKFKPIGNLAADPGYRRAMVKVLVARAVKGVVE